MGEQAFWMQKRVSTLEQCSTHCGQARFWRRCGGTNSIFLELANVDGQALDSIQHQQEKLSYILEGMITITLQGVALILKKGIKRTLIEWHPVNERMIRARVNGKHANLSIIQCYAPTNEANEEEKEAFYGRLQEEGEKVPIHDVLYVIGDLNAKVGSDNTNRESAMGKRDVDP